MNDGMIFVTTDFRFFRQPWTARFARFTTTWRAIACGICLTGSIRHRLMNSRDS